VAIAAKTAHTRAFVPSEASGCAWRCLCWLLADRQTREPLRLLRDQTMARVGRPLTWLERTCRAHRRCQPCVICQRPGRSVYFNHARLTVAAPVRVLLCSVTMSVSTLLVGGRVLSLLSGVFLRPRRPAIIKLSAASGPVPSDQGIA
jgi:hypothetical protein